MRSLSLKNYLIIVFGGLFIIGCTHLYFVIKTSSSELSQRHVKDVIELHYKLIKINIESTINQINDISEEIKDNPTFNFNNPSPQLRKNLINDFHQVPSLVSISLYNSNEQGVRITYVDKLLNIIPVNQSFLQSHWRYAENNHYLHLNNHIYLSYLGNHQQKIIIEISTTNVFNTIDRELLNNTDVSFHIYDRMNNSFLYHSNRNTPFNNNELISFILKKKSVVSKNKIDYNIKTNSFRNSNLEFITLIPTHVILKNLTPILDSLIKQIILYSIFCFIILIYISFNLSSKINNLIENANSIMRFEFKNQKYKKSNIEEIQKLSDSMKLISLTTDNILSQIVIISRTDNTFQLGLSVVKQIDKITNGASKLFIINKEDDFVCYEGLSKIDIKNKSKNYHKIILENKNIEYNFNLFNEKNKVIGCLQVYVTPENNLSNNTLAFIERLVHIISISIRKHNLLEQQKALFTAFTQSIASAIDTKSAHTANHCQRVPELTLMLAKAAQKNQAEWKDFSLSEQEWEELYLASWLHDCGKLTTADHVIDKATKLDMFTNRIHEIRTRYEVLKRDAEITYLKKLIDDKSNAALLQENYLNTIKELEEEFAFIAQSNLGDEFYHDDNIDRLHKLATRIFTRTLDKRLGLSWEEAQLLSDNDKQTPSIETVLQNNSSHLIPWDLNRKKNEQFNLKPYPFKFNHGEIYNLAVQRGTLTSEERFLINDHIIQTINMLKTLPYPDHLKNIPLIAGGHHEQMSGKGYPYGIPASELPITARMMAIADIFEALTASDRPYKTPKTLSESLKILAFMAKNKHIDASLFSLFLTDGVYLNYADKFLSSEQIDDVNIQELIEIAY
ncbi:hypothetical protein PVK62_10665 [Aliivibrio sp. S3MY1]|uniref:HD-GYP domain-containing protein n=1 Tax=unclassified Aliivibrio TaxID=2645654 RepID=UPI00237930CB|nr:MULTISPECIES: HD domain-containing phosphohydrolase [unclassified Aliivibrio]MDD9196295.1 hypothetical protein [Aliivibrio sp. S3MY1]MDD9200063.1 hypothetical protein [Aliivibrio sp. S2MY1]